MRVPTLGEIGERIRTLREKKNLSQEDLARSIGLHRVVLTKIELGKRPVKSTELLSIAQSLGVSMEDLVQNVKEKSLVARFRASGEVDEVFRADVEKVEYLLRTIKGQLKLGGLIRWG